MMHGQKNIKMVLGVAKSNLYSGRN